MSDYKNTLNLPQTKFPMKANLAQREPEILQRWEKIGIYQQLLQVGKSREKFILHLGPPYANGHIHLGTATTTVLKDIIVKTKIMSGFDSPLVPGWDCHGLPIEINVEKKLGKPGRKVNAEEFRQACREYAKHFIDIQREEFKRLGVIADWENPYLTMNPRYEANIIRSLAKIIEKGYLKRGSKPVHWCLDCGSALAEAEVEYMDKTSPAIDVRFKLADVNDITAKFGIDHAMNNVSVPIWTTTPWTLPANEAVALNPLLEYVLVDCDGKEEIIVAEDLLPAVLKRYQIQEHRILGRLTGEKLVGIKLIHPLYPEKHVPIVLGDHVTIETGTGAVHTAPVHGQEDYAVAKIYNLPLDNPVGEDGFFISTTPLFAGVFVRDANDLIIEELKKNDVLIHMEKITHSYPMCWRHKTPLIFLATRQWFVGMDQHGLREMALDAVKKVTWIPEWGESRIYGMIEGRPDWCISRQRTWGVPLSLFVHKETGELHPRIAELMEAVASVVEQEGIEAWYKLDPKTLLGDDSELYTKTNDVLDVWFDSGVSHECVLRVRPELKFPADIVLEGSDQHRGWFQSSLLTSTAMNGVASYKSVLTHGFVVDGEGRKMSKSLGNVIAPQEVIQNYGADVLRLWVASVDYRYEINASKEILTRASETYRRIRNTVRFLLANMHDFDPANNKIAVEHLLPLDLYIVDRARNIQRDIMDAYQTYQFHIAIQKIHHFCLVDLGGFYLDIIKDRQYTMQKESRGRRSAQTALYHIAEALVRWMAPITSFTAEEVWQFMPGRDVDSEPSVFLTTWYEHLPLLTDEALMNRDYWAKIRGVRDAVNKEIEKERNAGNIGSALEAEVYLYCDDEMQKLLSPLEDELRFVLITSFAKVIHEQTNPVDATITEVPGLSLRVVPTTEKKCDRCWHRRSDVGANKQYEGLCGRCVDNVAGPGEVRLYA